MTYSNQSRTCGEHSYIVQNFGDDLMKITNITASSGTVYYRNTAIAGALSGSFDPLNPTSNGWTAYTTTATQPIQAIAVIHGDQKLCQADGNFTINVFGEAKDPDSGDNSELATELEITAEVADTNGEENSVDNIAEHTIVTPGLDLALQISADPEGAYPGNIP